MSDPRQLRIEPTAPTSSAEAVHAARYTAVPTPTGAAEQRQPREQAHDQAVNTGGSLRAAYTEFVVDSGTHDVVVRIRDAATNEVLHEMPTPEVQSMMRSLNNYAEQMARHRAAAQSAGH